MKDVQVELAELRTTVAHGFTAINRRFDDQFDVQRDRHEENVERLQRIEQEAKDTNGRVTRHDEQIKTLYWRMPTTGKGTEEDRAVTKRDILTFLAGGGSIIAAWKFLAWAVPHLKDLA